MADYTLFRGDCLDIMPTLEPGSVALSIIDMPYAVTKCAWDVPFDQGFFWPSIEKLQCGKSVIAACCDVRLAASIIENCPLRFRYDLVYTKRIATGFLNANRMPLRAHELILIFSTRQSIYCPQMRENPTPLRRGNENSRRRNNIYGQVPRQPYNRAGERHPTSVLRPAQRNGDRGRHPTQKPVALLEWLIATYTSASDLVFDPLMGSGVTGVACANLGRRFVGIEKDPTYFAAAKARIEKAYAEAASGPRQAHLAV